VTLEIGDASPEAGDDVEIRQVRSRDQSQGGKAGFAVQPGMAQGNGGKCMGEVIHGTIENLKLEIGNSKTANLQPKLRNRNRKI
jgi:hypothetical protein